ncbi:hypothetical protein [Nonomuraea sp. PA05]|uniref:hypothetical protein n=1 Tax=Nonomuraea sp. PA05 TaxID=2604466 RepID=UPI001651DDDA|nr:hypothetical protein [Nonomuraea sp. PA05]
MNSRANAATRAGRSHLGGIQQPLELDAVLRGQQKRRGLGGGEAARQVLARLGGERRRGQLAHPGVAPHEVVMHRVPLGDALGRQHRERLRHARPGGVVLGELDDVLQARQRAALGRQALRVEVLA